MDKTQQVAETAKQLVKDTARAADERTSQIVTDSIREFFNESQEQKRFLDVARIPFICDDIKRIRIDMASMNGQVSGLARLIYIGIGIVMVAGVLVPILVTVLSRGIK